MSAATELRAELAELLDDEDYGCDLTISRPSAGGTYNKATGLLTPGADASTEYTGRGRVGQYSDRLVDGESIRRTDRRITFQPADEDFVPAEGDRVTRESDTWTIIRVITREIGGEWVSYTLQCR